MLLLYLQVGRNEDLPDLYDMYILFTFKRLLYQNIDAWLFSYHQNESLPFKESKKKYTGLYSWNMIYELK